MPWCPKCKNEYREGIDQCVDCGEALVEELVNDDMVPLIFGEEEYIDNIKEFMIASGITKITASYDEIDADYVLLVSKKLEKEAKAAISVYLSKVAEKTMNQEEPDNNKGKIIGTDYQSSEQKAKDNKASAYMLIILGGLGSLFIILSFTGIIPVSLGNKYIFSGVMGVIFLLFIVMGFVSMRNAKEFSKQAATENQLKEELLLWCSDNFHAETIDSELYMQDASPEIMYFKRVDRIKESILEKFQDIDANFLDSFIDETLYDTIFNIRDTP